MKIEPLEPSDVSGSLMEEASENGELMLPNEVAVLFRVDPKTVSRWETRNILPCIRTLGGHRRFYRKDVMALYDQANAERTSNTTS